MRSDLPSVYSDITEEYRAVRHRAGLSDFSHAGKLLFRGADRKKFLNGLVTNDVQSLKPWRGFPACLLTPKGKLQADFLLYDMGEELLALGLPRAIANLSTALSKVAILSQTKLEDVSGDALLYLSGPQAPLVLEALFGKLPAFEPYQAHPVERAGVRIMLLSDPRLSPEGRFLFAPLEAAQELWDSIMEAGKPLGLKPVGFDALNVLRIERGLPLFGVDMDEDTIPLEARLDDSISFTKGCYMGQETMSRIHHMGHVNRILVQLKLVGNGLAPAGAKVFHEDKEIGKITSAVWSPKFGSVLALATIRVEQSKAGTKLLVKDADAAREAEVIALDRAP